MQNVVQFNDATNLEAVQSFSKMNRLLLQARPLPVDEDVVPMSGWVIRRLISRREVFDRPPTEMRTPTSISVVIKADPVN